MVGFVVNYIFLNTNTIVLNTVTGISNFHCELNINEQLITWTDKKFKTKFGFSPLLDEKIFEVNILKSCWIALASSSSCKSLP